MKPESLQVPRQIKILLVILIVANVSVTAAAGMRFGFTNDDLMNGHRAMMSSYSLLCLNILEIWRVSPVHRPASMLVIKSVYSMFGLNVTAWRTIYSLLLIVMAIVTLEAVRGISRSFFAGSLAALLTCFHPSLRTLYFSTGLIFDVLAYILTGAFLIAYLRVSRSRVRRSALLYAVASIVFFWLALAAKEIAIAGALFVTVYELLQEPPFLGRLSEWIERRPLLWIVLALSIVFAIAQLEAPGSLTSLETYRPTFSIGVYGSHVREWGRLIAEGPTHFAAACVGILSGVVAFVRWPRLSMWCVVCLFTGILPVAFIPQREVDAILVPLLAGLTFLGVSIEALCLEIPLILSRRSILSARTAPVVAIGLGVAASALIIAWQGGPERRARDWALTDLDRVIMPALAALKPLPPPQPGDHFLIENDPFQKMQWSSYYLFRLYYRAPDLDVRRPNQVNALDLSVGRWRHLTWEDNRWKELSRGR
jgi:hypothetical protein